PVFTKITDSLGKVNVTDPNISVHGYSAPCFFNDSNKIKLFSGSETGRIFYYKDVESNLIGKFTAYDSILIFVDKDSATRYISEGMRSGVAVYDLNNDGYKDIITGNFAGGLCFYYGTKPQAASGIGEFLPEEHPGFSIYPNPATSLIKIELHKALETNMLVEFFDIIGHRVYAENLPCLPSLQIDISFLNSGFYTATISLPTGQKNLRRLGSSKFIIAR
ncbi:MAG TPA: T9SS type A sorting domain-containing protein, partial [Bacteroidales bacterium]|nr:T9SS type A sorting domain-containing protein [Bacteroidales bacterium]